MFQRTGRRRRCLVQKFSGWSTKAGFCTAVSPSGRWGCHQVVRPSCTSCPGRIYLNPTHMVINQLWWADGCSVAYCCPGSPFFLFNRFDIEQGFHGSFCQNVWFVCCRKAFRYKAHAVPSLCIKHFASVCYRSRWCTLCLNVFLQ